MSLADKLTSELLTSNYYWYDFWNEHGDDRVRQFPLMDGGPWPLLGLLALYLVLVLWIGPAYMRDRKPFELRKTIFLYNIAMVAFNAWMFMDGMISTKFGYTTWSCSPTLDRESRDPTTMKKLFLGWLFFASKIIEFWDTFFFVLRKKDSQISFLHVSHHSMVPFVLWLGIKFMADEQNAFFPLINAFVHTVMYSYYALSALGPAVQKYLWWKRHLTKLQMIQFVFIIINSLRGVILPDCSLPPMFITLAVFNASLFLALFASFYINAYLRSGSSKKKAIQESQPNNGTLNGKVSNGSATIVSGKKSE